MKRERLIKARMDADKSREEVAFDLEISEVYVRKIESGTSAPGRDMMIKFENYYGISMRELFPDLFLSIDDTNRIVDAV